MKICYASQAYNNPDWSSCTFLGNGFKRLDYDVDVCRYGEVKQGCDLYIDVDGGHCQILDRDKFRPVVSLVMDIFDEEAIGRSKKFEHAKTADYVVVMSEVDKRIMESNGINVNGIINWAINEDVWYPNHNIKKDCDAAFIGNINREMSKHRGELLFLLNQNGFSIKHSHMNHFLQDNANFLLSGKVGLNIPNRGFNSINQRDTEIIGCGLPLLTYGIDYFKHIIPNDLATFYKNSEDLLDKFKEIIHNIDVKRKNADKLRKFFLENHTYKNVAQRIVDIAVNGESYDMDYYKELWNG